MKTCEMLHCCGFFNKYEHSKQIDCRGFIEAYCKGSKMNECARLEYFNKFNKIPSDDMLPSGKMMECGESITPFGNQNQQYY